MPSALGPRHPSKLRARALVQLTGHQGGPESEGAWASAALRVLHDLASSPDTAADALALLHELQVHQVELDMQREELRNTRATLEAALARQMTLYDCAPVGCFTLARDTTVCEANATGTKLLGLGPQPMALLGQRLDQHLPRTSQAALHAMLARVADPKGLDAACTLVLKPLPGQPDLAPRPVHARAHADPAGARFFVVWMPA